VPFTEIAVWEPNAEFRVVVVCRHLASCRVPGIWC